MLNWIFKEVKIHSFWLTLFQLCFFSTFCSVALSGVLSFFRFPFAIKVSQEFHFVNRHSIKCVIGFSEILTLWEEFFCLPCSSKLSLLQWSVMLVAGGIVQVNLQPGVIPCPWLKQEESPQVDHWSWMIFSLRVLHFRTGANLLCWRNRWAIETQSGYLTRRKDRLQIFDIIPKQTVWKMYSEERKGCG